MIHIDLTQRAKFIGNQRFIIYQQRNFITIKEIYYFFFHFHKTCHRTDKCYNLFFLLFRAKCETKVNDTTEYTLVKVGKES